MAQLEQLFNSQTKTSPWQKSQWEKFATLGLPTKKLEEWKYTSLATLEKNEFPLGQKTAETGDISELLGELKEYPQVLLQDGFIKISPEAQGAFPHLQKIDSQKESSLKDFTTSSLVSLNSALNAGGISLRVTKSESQKILILVYASGLTGVVQNHPRHHIVVEENCELTLVEVFLGENKYWHNPVTTLEVKRGGKLNYAKLQEESGQAQHTGCTMAELAEDAHLTAFLFSSGSALQREEVLVRMKGKNSEAQLLGLCLAHGKQHHDVRTVVEHLEPHSRSSQLFKGILNDEARSVFNGRIYIAPNAQQVHSKQLNKNLLLSSKAEVDTKPELEIYADDVKATHGASVGPLSAQELFYLQSRGIPKDKAIELLVQGYVEDVIQKFPHPAVGQFVMSKIAQRVQEAQSRLKG